MPAVKLQYPNLPENWVISRDATKELYELPAFQSSRDLLADYPCCTAPQHELWLRAAYKPQANGALFGAVAYVYILCRACESCFCFDEYIHLKPTMAKEEVAHKIMLTTFKCAHLFCQAYGGYEPPRLDLA